MSDLSLSALPAVKPGSRFTFSGLQGATDTLLLAHYLEQHRVTVPVLAAVCTNAVDARRLVEELRWFAPRARVKLLPDWETLPYDNFLPHQDLISERPATLHDLQNSACDILFVPASTALQRVAPPSFLAAYTFSFKKGEKLDEVTLEVQFTPTGYEHINAVVRPGEYSMRGGLIDLFPVGSPLPYRLDLFGDEIETVRSLDPDIQRSLYSVSGVRLLPDREFPMDETSYTAFRGRWREVFEDDLTRSPIYKDIGNGVSNAGIEYYLPLFFEETATLFDYLPGATHPAFVDDIEGAVWRFRADTTQRYSFMCHDREWPLLQPSALYLDEEAFFVAAKPHTRLVLRAEPDDASLSLPLPNVAVNRRAEDPLVNLESFLVRSNRRVMIYAESAGRRETPAQMLVASDLHPEGVTDFADLMNGDAKFALSAAPLYQGFIFGDERVALIIETEPYARTVRRAGRRKQEQATAVDSTVRDLAKLKIGDPVVHSEHDIGRYQGLVSIDMGNGEEEFLHLDYDKNSKFYMPVHQLHMISCYPGSDPETTPLHSLGSGQWGKTKRKAAQQIRDTATELLNPYTRHALRQGFAFPLTPEDYAAFAESFSFEETPDQAAAIAVMIVDMTSGKPMDRLVCGDVGFGKTEATLRVTFVAIMGGKQVAILAPTTLLAEQHYQTLVDRFVDWPVCIAEIPRFRNKKEIDATIEAINTSTIDIVIGMHKLLSPGVKFDRPGLVIIDEEHRFGMRQRETLKTLRAEVDVLTLTATPVPRTLGVALEGLRNFSMIATAPQERLAIKTFLRREEGGVLCEAILRELKRGGQVYFLHNEVEAIGNKRAKLEELIPETHVVVTHGRMHEHELERVMRNFVAQRANILLCMTIIETGVDMPTANMILIHRADKFGLVQLHRLRGRVGHSHHQAYVYLLVHDVDGLTKQA